MWGTESRTERHRSNWFVYPRNAWEGPPLPARARFIFHRRKRQRGGEGGGGKSGLGPSVPLPGGGSPCVKRAACVVQTPHLVKVSLLLVQSGGHRVGPFHIHHQILDFSLQPLLGLLQGGTFRIHGLNLFLGVLKALSKFFP